MAKSLVTMAMLRAQWNDHQDYLDNFKPFIAEHFPGWPQNRPLDATVIAENVRDGVGIDLPVGVVQMLLDRYRKDGVLQRDRGDLFVVPERLDELPNLRLDRECARNEMDDLASRILRYVKEHLDLVDWDAPRVASAIERFLDALGTDFLHHRRRGSLHLSKQGTKDVAVVQSFARHASQHDERGLDLLTQAVYGSMLSSVVHYERPEDRSRRMDKLEVYLDTAVVLHLLGVCVPQLGGAAHELQKLLRKQQLKVRLFHHNYIEVMGVLDSTSANLRAGRNSATERTARLGRTSREVLDYFLEQGKTSADVEMIKAQLDQRLAALHIYVVDTPAPVEHLTVDESKLGLQLQESVGYRSESTRDKDVDSITAIHRLRNGRSAPELAGAQAIFVTTNTALVRASRRFFKEEKLNGGIPHVMADLELTTQLWIRTPTEHPDLPKSVLIADSFAALNPGHRFWDKAMEIVQTLKDEERVDDAQITALLFSTTARTALLDRTLGDNDNLEEQTIMDVLDGYAEDLAKPHVDAARKNVQQTMAAKDALTGAIAQLSSTVSTLEKTERDKDARIAKLEREATEKTEADAARKQLIRSVAGSVIVAVFGALTLALVFVTDLGRTLTTVLGSGAMAAAAAAAVWAFPPEHGARSLAHGFKVFIWIGAFLAVPGAIWAFAERDDGSTESQRGVSAVTGPIPAPAAATTAPK